MPENEDSIRHSRADSPDLVTDPEERARREARNSLRQVDTVEAMIESHWSPERPFRLRPSMILSLQRHALDGLSSFAGNYRPSSVEISKSLHTPPPAHLVPELVEGLCEYVNEQWENASALHLAAYVMWRLNWIHPFDDGNGRTARATAYLVLCVRLGTQLPSIGNQTVMDLIVATRRQYYQNLENADAVWKEKQSLSLEPLEKYIEGLLAKQLKTVLDHADGRT